MSILYTFKNLHMIRCLCMMSNERVALQLVHSISRSKHKSIEALNLSYSESMCEETHLKCTQNMDDCGRFLSINNSTFC